MSCSPGRGTAISLLVIGGLFVLLGAGVLLNFKATLTYVFGKRVVLSSSSQGFHIWTNVSDHLDTRVAWYFFNLTNPKEFTEGETPILQEVGPFWYQATLVKKNIVFHDNKTVSFEEHRRFEFDPATSVLPDTTNITMVNVPLMAALNKAANMGYFGRTGLSSALGSVEQAQYLVTNYSVRELTYTGQPNTLVALASLKDGLLDAVNALSNENTKFRFGFGHDKNMTNPGIFNMYTGATGTQDLNRIHSMNYQHVLDIWPSDLNNKCNIIDGTFGNLRAPLVEINEESIYVPDMCRPVKTQYVEDVKFHGLRLRRFNLSRENFLSSKEFADNSCYDKQFEMPSGVIEVGPCKKGAPVLMSMPHFMGADPSFAQKVKGMNPDPEKHTFIMDHEPTTGMTVSVRGRLQANIRIVPTDILEADYLPELLMPLFWQEMYVEAGPEIVSFLKKVTGYPGLAKIAMIIITLVGLILVLIGVGLLLKYRNRTNTRHAL